MDIPDLNYSQSKKREKKMEVTEFYSVDENKSDSEITDEHIGSAYEDNFKIILEDEIEKKTLNISWQTRYFCLTPTRLLYYSSKNKSEIKGCFNLQSFSKQYLIFMEVREQQKTLKLTLYLNQQNEQQFKDLILLNFQYIPERYNLWKNWLNKIIEGIPKKKSIIHEGPKITIGEILGTQPKMNKVNFWNKIIISLKEFFSFANHLDIVFFKSKNPLVAFQRLLMRSQFDHVAILLKDNCDCILVLEAIESRGVWINEWNQMLPIFKEHYEEIAYRKLLLNPKQKIDLQQLENYLDMVIGTKYELSLSKLFIPQESEIVSQSKVISHTEQNKNQEKQKIKRKKSYQQTKTFFCSELIADIYIKLGFIKGKKRNQFWPRDFQGSIQLQMNAKLSPLMYISLQ